MATGRGRQTQNRSPGRQPARQPSRQQPPGGRGPQQRRPQAKKSTIPWPVIGWFLAALGVVMFFCLVTPTNAPVIVAIRTFANGNFGKMGGIAALIIVAGGIQLAFGERWPFQKILWVQAALLAFSFATLLQVFRIDDMLRSLRVEGYVQNYNGFLWKSYETSRGVPVGGGALGALLAYPMSQYLDITGSVLVLVLVLLGIVLWIVRTLVPSFGDRVAEWFSQLRDDLAEQREERAANREAELIALEEREREEEARRQAEYAQNMQAIKQGASKAAGVAKNVASKAVRPKKKAAPPQPKRTLVDTRKEIDDDFWPDPEWTPESDWRNDPNWKAADDWLPEPQWDGDAEETQTEWHPGLVEEPQMAELPLTPPKERKQKRKKAAAMPPPQPPATNVQPMPQRPASVAAGKRLYIEDVPPVMPAGGHSEYERPAAQMESAAMPEYVVKRRQKIDEEYGPVQLHPRAEAPPEPPSNIAYMPTAAYEAPPTYEEAYEPVYEPAPEGMYQEPVYEEPEEYISPFDEDMPPAPVIRPPAARQQSARPMTDHRDRQPQLDPQERLDRPNWTSPKPPEPAFEPEELAYNRPPFSLLVRDEGRVRADTNEEDLRGSQKLEETFKSFGVSVKVINVVHGPAITRYELQPAPGVKVSKIVGLTDDIALSMAAVGVRIEAPIPGKAAIGIEIANAETQTVHLRDVLESEEARRNPSKLAVALGKDIAGKSIIADLARMPHLLIAGQTGSGKSVCINTLITSILYRATPEEVRMILIDPKKVELAAYNGIPHLLVPVVTDPKKASGALNWAVMEMDERYKLFAEKGVRDIKGYNAHRDAETPLLPQIVVIIDELSDLMLVAPGEVEEAICRIAQLARACGIHLVVATQRPSVNVITGIIKANIPSRIAFEVSSQVDSRTILDTAGAEKLLGKGDMLFAPSGGGKPRRVQGCFVSDEEVGRVVEYVKESTETEYSQDVLDALETVDEGTPAAAQPVEKAGGGDALFEQAVEMAIEAGQTSISMLQRRLRIGYARAGRLVDEMAQRGIIGQADGAKPREVLMTREEYNLRFSSGNEEA